MGADSDLPATTQPRSALDPGDPQHAQLEIEISGTSECGDVSSSSYVTKPKIPK
jgi:hypothetical protein